MPVNLIAGANVDVQRHGRQLYTCKIWCGGTRPAARTAIRVTPTVIDLRHAAHRLPVYEGFEYTTGTALPACWDSADVNSDNYRGAPTRPTPRSGLRNAYIQYVTWHGHQRLAVAKAASASTAERHDHGRITGTAPIASTSYTEALEVKAGRRPTWLHERRSPWTRNFTVNSTTYDLS